MPNKRTRTRKSRSKSRQQYGGRKHRYYKGGSSAATYVTSVAGSPEQQYNNTFSQSGPYGQIQGNVLPLAGQSMVPSGIPNAQQLQLVQSAGSSKKISRRGGSVIGDAIVPFGLLALQNRYGKGRHNSRKYKTVRKNKKSKMNQYDLKGGMDFTKEY